MMTEMMPYFSKPLGVLDVPVTGNTARNDDRHLDRHGQFLGALEIGALQHAVPLDVGEDDGSMPISAISLARSTAFTLVTCFQPLMATMPFLASMPAIMDFPYSLTASFTNSLFCTTDVPRMIRIHPYGKNLLDGLQVPDTAAQLHLQISGLDDILHVIQAG